MHSDPKILVIFFIYELNIHFLLIIPILQIQFSISGTPEEERVNTMRILRFRRRPRTVTGEVVFRSAQMIISVEKVLTFLNAEIFGKNGD